MSLRQVALIQLAHLCLLSAAALRIPMLSWQKLRFFLMPPHSFLFMTPSWSPKRIEFFSLLDH